MKKRSPWPLDDRDLKNSFFCFNNLKMLIDINKMSDLYFKLFSSAQIIIYFIVNNKIKSLKNVLNKNVFSLKKKENKFLCGT